MGSELRPRLCFLTKGDHGYGFHLHGERNRGGQLIRKIEPGSSAELSGLRPGDRVVEVNGENVEEETHHQVVERIRAHEHRTRLLVVDRETDEHLRGLRLPCTEDLAVEMGVFSPRSTVSSSSSPLRSLNGLVSPKELLKHWARPSGGTRSPTDSFPDGGPPARCIGTGPASVSSYSGTEAESPSGRSSPAPPEAEQEEEAELAPRLCHLTRQEAEPGYGFDLQSYGARRGQFMGSVEPGSAAGVADVRKGDRLLQVNGENVEGLRHSEVVALIQKGDKETRLLVVDLETDELFLRLGVLPSYVHIQEVSEDGPIRESPLLNSSPTTARPKGDPPIINITLSDSPIRESSLKSGTNGSSASRSSWSSTTRSELSSSDMSIQVPDEEEKETPVPLLESGLRLSPTAAEAREKAFAKRNKKRAPPMDWNRKYEIFSNF